MRWLYVEDLRSICPPYFPKVAQRHSRCGITFPNSWLQNISKHFYGAITKSTSSPSGPSRIPTAGEDRVLRDVCGYIVPCSTVIVIVSSMWSSNSTRPVVFIELAGVGERETIRNGPITPPLGIYRYMQFCFHLVYVWRRVVSAVLFSVRIIDFCVSAKRNTAICFLKAGGVKSCSPFY